MQKSLYNTDFYKIKNEKDKPVCVEKDYILPNFKLQFSHNIFPRMSVCQNSDEIKATDPHNIRMSLAVFCLFVLFVCFVLFFVFVSLYIFTDRNKPQKTSLHNNSWFYYFNLESLLMENIKSIKSKMTLFCSWYLI